MPEQPPSPADRIKRIASRARTLAVCYFLLLFLGTHLPSTGRHGPSFYDKWAHFGGYAVLTVVVLAGWELTVGALQARHYFAVWLAGTVYGAIDEWTQIPVGRSCDMNDWLADVLGIVCGLAAYRCCRSLLFRVVGWRPPVTVDETPPLEAKKHQ